MTIRRVLVQDAILLSRVISPSSVYPRIITSHCNITALFSSSSNDASPTNATTNTIGSSDYFQALGIKRSYSLSLEELKTSYKKLMVEIHPDRHSMKPADERQSIADLASNVTRGYGVLKDDHARALHLLKLEGEPMEDTISGDVVGQDFLMMVMELREEVDLATTQNNHELKSIREENSKRIREVCHEIGIAFDENNLDEAKRLTAMLQYWNKIEEEILEKVD